MLVVAALLLGQQQFDITVRNVAVPGTLGSRPSISQEIQHEAVAINIEVPVRVFKGDTFIDNLTIEDFEILEEGIIQEIEAVYFIKKTSIEREERSQGAEKVISPEVSRHFVMAFEVISWLPKIADLVDHFFDIVYQPGDTLIITTPVKTYHMSHDVLEAKPKSELSDQLKSLLRKDILRGNMDYRSQLRDYRQTKRPDLFRNLRDYKYFDEAKIQKVSDYLKQIEGQKHIFLFYQKEELPIDEEMDRLEALSPASFDVEKIKRAFSDSSITTHFIFLTKDVMETLDAEQLSLSQEQLVDVSGEVFSSFYEIAKATGGVVLASANAGAAFKQASDASENYYLLYYTPKQYRTDGEFKNIKVRIKGQKYRGLTKALLTRQR
jgi:hypothetical protein